MVSDVDVTVPVYGAPTTASVRDNFQTVHDEITALQAAMQSATAAGPFLPLAGNATVFGPTTFSAPSTFSGPITFNDGSTGTINVLMHGAKGDGVTNDTTAIQNVITAYAGKATVFIPDTGLPYMCFPLVPITGSDILIMGTLKLLPASPNALIVVNTGKTRITLRGNGVLDGNASAQTAAVGNVYLNGSSNIRVSGLTIQNSKEWNLNVVGCSDVVVDGVTMLGGNASNEFAGACDDCWLTNCTITGVRDIAFAFYGGVTNSGAIGNTINQQNLSDGTNVYDAINVMCDSSQPTSASNILIADNIAYNCGVAISIAQGAGGTGVHTGVVVNNNRAYNCSMLGHADHCVGALFIGNQGSNFTAAPTIYGFYAGSSATSTNFIGNQISHINPGTTTGYGLFVASANITYACGNQFIDNQAPQIMTYAIGGTAGARSAFVGNFCDLPNALTLQADTVMANVVGGRWTINNQSYSTLPINAANDAAAAAAGVIAGGVYRNGSALQVRVV